MCRPATTNRCRRASHALFAPETWGSVHAGPGCTSEKRDSYRAEPPPCADVHVRDTRNSGMYFCNKNKIFKSGTDPRISSQTTVNLKKVELPVKQIVSGKIIKPSGTLLNPKSLDFYYQFAKVETLRQSKL